MRHRMKGRKLGRTASHRKATMASLALAIIEHKEIRTTLAKAKEARRYVERLITYTKKDTVHARRLAYKILNNHQAVKQLFDEIGPVFTDRPGGYTRVIKLGQRLGDGAEMAILQLVGFEKFETTVPSPKKTKKAAPKKETQPAENEKKEEVKATETEAAETEEKKSAAKEPAAPETDEKSEETPEENAAPASEEEPEKEAPSEEEKKDD